MMTLVKNALPPATPTEGKSPRGFGVSVYPELGHHVADLETTAVRMLGRNYEQARVDDPLLSGDYTIYMSEYPDGAHIWWWYEEVDA